MEIKYLFIMFPNKERRTKFIVESALTFGLRLETLSEVLGFDEKNLYYELIYKNNYKQDSLDRLFRLGMNVQEEAKENFINFFNSLVDAYKKKDITRYQTILDIFKDNDATRLANRKINYNYKMTEEDTLALLKYQLKHSLSVSQMELIFHMYHGSYDNKVNELAIKYPVLVSQYNGLKDKFDSPKKGGRS